MPMCLHLSTLLCNSLTVYQCVAVTDPSAVIAFSYIWVQCFCFCSEDAMHKINQSIPEVYILLPCFHKTSLS